jgi:hypothetical protein
MKKRDAIVLIAICGLAVVSAGALRSSGRQHARAQMCAANMRNIGSAMSAYGDTYDGRLPQMEYNTGTYRESQQHPWWAFRDRSSVDSTKWRVAVDLGCLYKAALIQNPGTFYCPADSRWTESMKSYATGGGWGQKVPTLPVDDPFLTDNPDPWQRPDPSIACLRLNVAYWPQSRNVIANAARLAQIQRETNYEVGFPDIPYTAADLDPGKACVSDTSARHMINGPPAAGGDSKGQSSLFGDGHVAFGPLPKDPVTGITYRICQEMEYVGVLDGVSNRTNRYFFYVKP